VHGGLVVLESSFSGETMASALGISPSKNIVRRHLITEFEALILPSRCGNIITYFLSISQRDNFILFVTEKTFHSVFAAVVPESFRLMIDMEM
jgi:hypothetical protein